jgi:conjugal transfer ATP-binding protein TraC
MIAVVGDRNTFKTKADMMSARKTQLAESPSGRYIPGITEEAAEWKQAVSALSDGATMCYLGLKVGIISPAKLVAKNTSEVKAVWRNRGFTIHEDTYLQPLGFKSMIPMGIGKMVTKDLHSMGHLSPKYSTNAVSLSPLIAEWKGTGTNTITLFGRRGQIMGIDLYDNDKGNYNFAVVAGSGSGKSFFLNELAFAYLSKGAKVWIIDVGRSYVKLCSVLKGDFVEFSEKSSPCLNPFTFVVDIKEEMEILKPLLSQMMTGDDYRLTSVQFSELEVAIQRTWEKYGNDASITKVREEMLEMANPNNPSCPVAAMAKMLYTWTKDGTYGEYFEGRANLDFNNSFTVLELEELNAKKSLQTVVLMILMYRITNEMYVKRDGQKKIVIIDEAWALMNGGDTAEFIEKGYRRARKYGGAFGTATQSVDDYYRNEASEAAINNADFVFMLRQKKESIERIGKEGKIHMDAWKKRTLLDLTTKGGVYSEIYVSSPIGEGVGRLFVDPYTSLLYSSKDEDYQAITSYETQGYETAEAIEMVLRDRGVM